jgi:hypothetical protein
MFFILHQFRVSVQFDSRVLLDLRLDKAHRQVFQDTDGESSGSKRTLFCLRPNFWIAHCIQVIVACQGQL